MAIKPPAMTEIAIAIALLEASLTSRSLGQ